MTTIKYLHKILLAALASLPLVSCVEEEITKGEQENDSYGVYFKDLTAAQKNVEFDPAQKAELKFTAYRTKEANDIVVPLEIVVTNAKNEDAKALFDVQELSFADGQKENDFTISFPEAELGMTYNVSVTCKDPEYVKIYAQLPTSFSFKVTRVKWNQLEGPNGEKYGSWKDDLFRSAYGVPTAINDKIIIEERADKKGYFRIIDVYNPYMIAQFFGVTPDQVVGNCTPGTITYIDATKPDKVWLKEGSTGATLNADEGYLLYASQCPENGFEGSGIYGMLQDGVIRFPKEGLLFGLTGMPGKWFRGNNSGETIIVLPGYRDFDYNLKLQTGLSKKGSLPFQITVGEDLAKVNYQFFEGKISNTDIPFKALEVARNEKAEFVVETKKLEAKLPKTGIYTLIAAGLDKEQNMQSYQAKEVCYVADGDTKPVMLTCGIGSAGKYGAQGISTDRAVEIYLYGKDLVDVKFGVVSAKEFEARPQQVLARLLNLPSVKPEVLKQINENGLSEAVSGLIPGTEYLLLTYASNGYEEKFIASENSEFTTGEAKPSHKQFFGIEEKLLPKTKDGYYGTYNVYAIGTLNKEGLRTLVSQVKLSDGGTVGEGEKMQDLIKVENFWGKIGEEIKLKDEFYFEFGGGVLYTIITKFGLTNYQKLYAAHTYSIIGTQQLYPVEANYAMYAGYAEEGFIPFFSNTKEELAITLSMFSDPQYQKLAGTMEMYENLLFINVNNDESAKDPEVKPTAAKLIETPMHIQNAMFTKGYRQPENGALLQTLSTIPTKGMHQAVSVKAEISNYDGEFVEEPQDIKLKSDLQVVNR